jgi:hypothetical protein
MNKRQTVEYPKRHMDGEQDVQGVLEARPEIVRVDRRWVEILLEQCDEGHGGK